MIGIQSKPHWLLLLGSCLLLIYIIFITIFFYRSSEEAQKQFISSLLTTEYPIQISLYTSFFYFWQMVYLSSNTYVIFKLFRNNQKQKVKTLPQHFDFIIKFVGLFWILNLLLLSLYILLPIYVVDCIYLPICVSIIYTFILYYSYHFSFDLNGAIHETSTNIEEKKPFVSKKQVLSETNNEKCRIIHTLIESALEKDKIYLNPDLTLKELSDQIGYPSYLVSHTINSYFKKNFFELINEKRILEAERRIKLSTGIEKIESIAYDVGFNSRTSFYRAYKKHLGHTPIVRNSLTDNE
jgi:AraC-like DNA-binding protein